jgi:hypothetical protein
MPFVDTMGRVRSERRAPFLLCGLRRGRTLGCAAARALCAALASAFALALLASCDRQPPPPVAAIPRQEILPALETAVLPAQYPNLDADPQRHLVLAAYLEAWNARQAAPDAVAPARAQFLALYAEGYRAHVGGAADAAGFDARLRLLWDLAGVAHTTGVSPAEINRACAWQEPPAAAALAGPPVVLAELRTTPLLIALERLPALTRQMLTETRLDTPGGQSAAELVAQAARGIYLTPQLSQWSPSCPLDVCGSSEPLTRTLILTPVGQVDLAAKPDWSLAAVALHEAAHVAWFHRPEVSRDPRLLLPVPNEREAWRQTAQFLRGLLRSASPELRQHVQTTGPDIRAMLQRSREQVARANRVLRLAESDESLLLALPEGLAERDLRALPR